MIDESKIDFEHLTKEQALYLHRKLWNAIADKTLEFGRPVEKWEIFWMYEWPRVTANCWCCEYSRQQYLIDRIKPCDRCPINWGGKGKACQSNGSPYDKWNMKICLWSGKKKFSKSEIEEFADLAKQIANLPEKE